MANSEKITFWHILIAIILFTIAVIVIEYTRNFRKNDPDEIWDCLIELNSINFFGSVSASHLCFVLFYVEDFEWCNVMMSNLNSLAKDEQYDADYYKVNLDKHPEFDLKHNISGTPNILIFRNGVEIKRIMGVVSQSNLKKIYNKNRI